MISSDVFGRSQTPSPYISLPEGEGSVKQRLLCSLSPWERVGVRAVEE
jgi:hypothetical protein